MSLIAPAKQAQPKEELVAFRIARNDLVVLKGRAQELGVGHSTLIRMVVKKYLAEEGVVGLR